MTDEGAGSPGSPPEADWMEFRFCPACGREAAHENHLISGPPLYIHGPMGTFPIVPLICVRSLPDDQVDSHREPAPIITRAFFVHGHSFQESVKKLDAERQEAEKKLGKEIMGQMDEIGRKLDEPAAPGGEGGAERKE